MISKFFVIARYIYSVAKARYTFCEQGDLYSKDHENLPNYSGNRNHAFSRKRGRGEIQIIGKILWTTTTTTRDGIFAFIGAYRTLSKLYGVIACDSTDRGGSYIYKQSFST